MPLNSLGIDKTPADTRVVVAMSGGVDSSVTAAMLADQGYDVVGITLQLYDHGAAINKAKACCAGQDIMDARRVADHIGIPHYVLDYESRFKQSVIDDFADSYLRGETPIPCVRCNQTVKFKDLLQTAHELEADCMATGHYVRRVGGATGAQLVAAADKTKDQSYFLFATTQEQLDFLRFPLGDLDKQKTREIGESLGLHLADKPDSQDICFVPTGGYAEVIRKIRPEADKPGDIVDMQGKVLAPHKGIINYTIGQRRGLGLGNQVSGGTILYVVGIDADNNQVVVGPKPALARDIVITDEINWLGDWQDRASQPGGVSGMARLRSTMPPEPATIEALSDGRARITLQAPHYGIAAGQAAVFYNGDEVMGGGWIKDTAQSETFAAA
ncbi:MAG: tRNA 2-thiouridine(34) synthase MnmA [Alphaproteobacteria bacterium]